jgi:steroid delta-isomerase-like uncharacterized protein
MSVQPESVIRAWFDEVWNQGREETIDRIFAPDAVAHGLPGGSMRGPDAFRPLFQAFRGAFPDIQITILRTVTEGEVVAAHCRVTGTHTGATLPLAPTGRRVDFEGMTIARIVDGQVREGWNCFDFLTMYQQLEAVPPVPGHEM